jgi:hypothetical protein
MEPGCSALQEKNNGEGSVVLQLRALASSTCLRAVNNFES